MVCWALLLQGLRHYYYYYYYYYYYVTGHSPIDPVSLTLHPLPKLYLGVKFFLHSDTFIWAPFWSQRIVRV